MIVQLGHLTTTWRSAMRMLLAGVLLVGCILSPCAWAQEWDEPTEEDFKLTASDQGSTKYQAGKNDRSRLHKIP